MLSRPKEPDGSVKRWIQDALLIVERIVAHFGFRTQPESIATRHSIGRYNHSLLRRLSPSGADNHLAMLRAILFRAYDWGLLKHPPYVKLNRLDRKINRFISAREEERLLKHCDSMLQGFVCFLFDTGARKSEATQMLWRDVDLSRRPRPSVTLVYTKNNDARTVPLPKRTARILRRMAKQRHREDMPVFSQPASMRIINQHGLLYAEAGQMIPMSNLEPKWKRAKAAAGLKDVRLHDLRHTYASRLLKHGAPLFTVGRLLGHKTLSMTMRYAHLSTEGLDEVVELLDRS